MKCKNFFSFLLAFFLLVSNSGLAFNVHFCGKKIAAISSVFSNEEVCDVPINAKEICCVKLKTEHKKCCSDKEVNLKDKSEKFTFKSLSFDLDLYFCIIELRSLLYNNAALIFYAQHIDFYCDAHAPPLYKLYCQFTLFG